MHRALTIEFVPAAVDLSVTNTVSGTAAIGSAVTYTVVVTNNASAFQSATGVKLANVLSPGETLVSATTTQSTCTGAGPVICDLGTLAPGASASVTLTVRPDAVCTISNTASVTADQAETNTANNSSTASINVSKAATTTSLSADNVAPTFGQPVTFTAVVAPAAATGTVVFSDGANTLGMATLTGGSASLTVSSFSGGTHSIVATYEGDNTYAASTSAALAVAVSRIASSTVLASNANPSFVGQGVTLTATVGPAGAAGAVQFYDATTVLGGATLSGGTATLTVSFVAAGSHSLTAVYAGDGNYAGSTSAVLIQAVNKNPSATALSSSGASVMAGQSVTFTATVTPASATGSVDFRDGAASLGSGTLNNGAAAFTTSTLGLGTHSITAVYGGDAMFLGSSSAAVNQVINNTPAGANVSVQPFNESTKETYAGGTVTFSVLSQMGLTTITTQTSGPALPDNFRLGTPAVYYNLGTTAAYSGSINVCLSYAGITYLNTSTIKLLHYNSGAGAWEQTDSSAGPNSMICGTVSSLSPFVVVEDQGTATTLASSSTAPAYGQSITLTATVAPAGGTGTVESLDGAASLGSAALSDGTAMLATSALAVGSHSVTARYAGDGYFRSSTSAALSIAVSKADQTITFAPIGNKTFGDAAFPVSATANSGLPVSFAASGNCTVSGNTITITGAGSCTITATQGGNDSYNAAAPMTRSFTIAKATATIDLGILTFTYNGAPRPVSPATPPAGLTTLTITYNGSATAPTNAGSYTVLVTLTNDNYEASPASDTLINKAPSSITFGVLADKTYGDPPFTVSATADSGLTVSFAAAGNCTVFGSTVTVTAAGSCTITATQGGNENYNPAAPVSRLFSITKAHANISISNLAQVFTNTAKSVTVTTSPAGLSQEGVPELVGSK